MKSILPTLLLCSLITGLSCRKPFEPVVRFFSKQPETAAVRDVLRTAVPLGYAASLALSAVGGDTAPQVRIIDGLAGFPGTALIAIDISAQHPLPASDDTSGTIMVAGMYSSAQSAVMSVFFTRPDIPSSSMAISNISTFPVSRDDTGMVTIVWASEDVNSGSDTMMVVSLTDAEMQVEFTRLSTAPPLDSTVEISQDAWIVYVDPGDSAPGPPDYIYTVWGGGQYAGVSVQQATVVQLVMIGATMRHQCRRNPFDGAAILRTFDISLGLTSSPPEIGTSLLTFHEACDGNAKLSLATGVYIGTIGASIPLGLSQ